MLDPQARAFLDQMAASGRPPTHKLSPREAREASDAIRAQLAGVPEDVADVRELAIPGPAGTIPARLYVPAGSAPHPIVVYFHGGGFVIGSLAGWDPVMRALANASGCAVVSVDYRLAPEHKFPAAVLDAYAAFAWVANEAPALGADPARLAVAGDSAGGNLAAVVSLLARDGGGPRIALQLLVYPGTERQSNRAEYASYQKYGEDHGLTKDMMDWFSEQYSSPENVDDWRMHPLRAESLRDLPPARILVAECDPLCDEGIAYADRLRAEGGSATVTSYPGMIHGFFAYPAVFDQGRQAIRDAGDALREAFALEPVGAAAAKRR